MQQQVDEPMAYHTIAQAGDGVSDLDIGGVRITDTQSISYFEQ